MCVPLEANEKQRETDNERERHTKTERLRQSETDRQTDRQGKKNNFKVFVTYTKQCNHVMH